MKQTIILEWSHAFPLKNFDKNYELKKKMQVPGVYANIVSQNGFNRITYIGEASSIYNRWCVYYKSYHCNNDNNGHTIDLNKIEDDPYNYFTEKNGNTIEKLIEKQILFNPETYKGKCSEDFLKIRREYFDKSFIAFATNDQLEDQEVRWKVESNLQKHFVEKYKILSFSPGNFLIGLCNAKYHVDPNLIIINKFSDEKLIDLPDKIELTNNKHS